jgi:Xaa-Pro aminopeptidase
VSDLRLRRQAALVERLVASNLDGLVIASLPNIRYLTGFSGSNAIVLVTRTATLLVTDFRYETQVAEESGRVAQIRIETTNLWSALWGFLTDATGIEAIGFESAHLRHRDFQRLLEDGSRWRWRPTMDLVESLRESKDASEVACIRAASAMASRALERTFSQIAPGMTELQAAGLLEQQLREAGSEGYPFATIVASGPRTALPHARPSGRAIARGDFLLFDFGAVAGGYCCDITRTVVVGAPTERQRDVYEAVQTANELARVQVRAGMRGKDADAIARAHLERCGLDGAFGHGLGHGIGLEVHEGPRMSRATEAVLPIGAVVTVEPGVYLPDWGGVRIEDNVWLTQDGPELLTDLPRDLMAIG